ncbi:hypothetical protein M231_08115 [Tremella mesenterica]|uniref:OTU domain-containing protein n=1 Tax=Tremella mesenterica TaxID=5217 RepID=A0A4Q1B7I5_TREME|nr:hypothetical protein M231_08115 [Tremella mesenterica]
MIDVLAAVGWNAGLRAPTKSMSEDAWWKENIQNSEEDTSEDTILTFFREHYKTSLELRALLKDLRKTTVGKYIPCQVNPNDSRHRYHLHGQGDFRLRCHEKTCQHHLRGQEALKWFAALAVDGRVNLDGIGFSGHISSPQSNIHTLSKTLFRIPPLNQLIMVKSNPPLYKTRWIVGDGDCMFSALSTALNQRGVTSKVARMRAVKYARERREFFEPFVADYEGGFVGWLKDMGKQGVYGNHPILQALCQVYDVTVDVLKETDTGMEWMTVGEGSQRVKLFLSHEHYENLISGAELL